MLRRDAPAKSDFEDDVNGDVVVLLMLLETQFMMSLIVVTAFLGIVATRWRVSCSKSEQMTREATLGLGATKRLGK